MLLPCASFSDEGCATTSRAVLSRGSDQIRRGDAAGLRGARLAAARQGEDGQSAGQTMAQTALGLGPGVEGDDRHGPRPGRTVCGLRARAGSEGIAQVEGGAALDFFGGGGGVAELQGKVLLDIVEGVGHAAQQLRFLHD